MAASASRNRIIIIVVGIVAALVAAALVRVAFTTFLGGGDKQDLIETTVSELKDKQDLPKQVDQVTTWTDVRSEDSAIHYYYSVSGVDPSALSKSAIRDSVLPTLCSTKSTKDILDRDIHMKYSYVVEDSSDEYDFDFEKSDC